MESWARCERQGATHHLGYYFPILSNLENRGVHLWPITKRRAVGLRATRPTGPDR
jgi:hypothetical protein